jgi:hypothetical protein
MRLAWLPYDIHIVWQSTRSQAGECFSCRRVTPLPQSRPPLRFEIVGAEVTRLISLFQMSGFRGSLSLVTSPARPRVRKATRRRLRPTNNRRSSRWATRLLQSFLHSMPVA